MTIVSRNKMHVMGTHILIRKKKSLAEKQLLTVSRYMCTLNTAVCNNEIQRDSYKTVLIPE